jgi:hydrogenase maturation protease
MTAEKQKILVLGVGNILLKDEGVGVYVIKRLEEEYEFSDNVEVFDGGTLGLRLTDQMTCADHVIVVDCVLNNGKPGDLYRLVDEDLRLSVAFKQSMHDLDLLETLCCCEIIGQKPTAVVIGIEPEDYQSGYGTELTETLQAKVPEMMERVLKEVKDAGGSYSPRVMAHADEQAS